MEICKSDSVDRFGWGSFQLLPSPNSSDTTNEDTPSFPQFLQHNERGDSFQTNTPIRLLLHRTHSPDEIEYRVDNNGQKSDRSIHRQGHERGIPQGRVITCLLLTPQPSPYSLVLSDHIPELVEEDDDILEHDISSRDTGRSHTRPHSTHRLSDRLVCLRHYASNHTHILTNGLNTGGEEGGDRPLSTVDGRQEPTHVRISAHRLLRGLHLLLKLAVPRKRLIPALCDSLPHLARLLVGEGADVEGRVQGLQLRFQLLLFFLELISLVHIARQLLRVTGMKRMHRLQRSQLCCVLLHVLLQLLNLLIQALLQPVLLQRLFQSQVLFRLLHA